MPPEETPIREDLRRRAEEIFQEAVDLDRKARPRFVDEQCAGDSPLREAVERLLDAVESMGDFLGQPTHVVSGASPAEEPVSPTRIGAYEIVRLLGAGGMGIVYEARQESPQRRVALKVIHPALASSHWLKRFEREADMLGHLQHSGIATVYEAGTAEVIVPGRPPAQQPFLAMELVDGLPLDDYAKANKLDTRRRLELVARICDAVQHAHDRGIVHRDLKPGNVLVPADGQPKVLDFGIARATGADWQTLTVGTAAQHLIGTIPYMSPEQIGGTHDAVDARSDVYALGVILYELLSGRLPIDTRTRSLPEALRAIREDEPSGLGSQDSALRGDVDAIVGKALRKEKERRYASAGEMAEDIRRYLRSEPILARPPSTLYHLRRFARRNKAVVFGVAATIVALVLGLIVATGLARREARQRRLAETSAEQAQRALVEARLDEAVALLALRDSDAAARSLAVVPEERRGWEWKHLNWRARQFLLEIPAPVGHSGMALARDAPLMFLADGEGVVRVWDFETLEQVGELVTGILSVRRLATDPQGTLLFADTDTERIRNESVATKDRHIIVWDVRSGRELWRRSGATSTGSFSPDGALVAVGLWDRRKILLLDALTGEVREEVPIPHSVAQTPSFGPDGRRLVFGSRLDSGVVDRPTGRARRFPGLALTSFTKDGNAVLGSRSSPPKALLVRLDTGETVGFPGTRHVAPLAAPDGRRFLVADEVGTAVMRLGALDDPFPLGGGGSGPVGWSHDGSRVVTVERDYRVKIWDGATDTRVPRIVTHGRTSAESEQIYGRWNEALAISPDGRIIATAGWRFVTLRARSTGSEIWNAYRLEAFPNALAFSPDGEQLALAGRDGPVTIVDAATGETDRVLPRSNDPVAGLVWDPTGDRLVVASVKGDVAILDASTGASMGRLEGADGEIRCLTRSPDGGRIVAGGLDGVAVWDQPDGRLLGVLRAGSGSVDAVAFDAGGRKIAAVTSTGELIVWDVASLDQLSIAVLDSVAFQSVAFAPGGERIVIGGVDGKLRFWDPRTNEHVVTLETGLYFGSFVEFTPDGRTIVAGGGDGMALLETGPPPGGFSDQTRAHDVRRLVDELYNRLLFADDVAGWLREDRELPEEIRAEALELVRIRGDHIGWLNSDAITAYRITDRSADELRLALRKIELANRLWPDRPEYVANLGKCQYRSGVYREALASLRRARELYVASGKGVEPQIWAFVAMAHWRLGEHEQARETMRILESSMAEPLDDSGPWNRLFFEEATALVGG